MANMLHLEDGYLQIKGATRVVSTTQNQAIIETENKSIVVSGNEIEVKKLNLDECEVCLCGRFSTIKLDVTVDKKQPLLKRLFK